jgi:hypothetical protein
MSLTDIGTRYMHLSELADLWRDGLLIHERFMNVDSPSDGLKKKKLEYAIELLQQHMDLLGNFRGTEAVAFNRMLDSIPKNPDEIK